MPGGRAETVRPSNTGCPGGAWWARCALRYAWGPRRCGQGACQGADGALCRPCADHVLGTLCHLVLPTMCLAPCAGPCAWHLVPLVPDQPALCRPCAWHLVLCAWHLVPLVPAPCAGSAAGRCGAGQEGLDHEIGSGSKKLMMRLPCDHVLGTLCERRPCAWHLVRTMCLAPCAAPPSGAPYSPSSAAAVSWVRARSSSGVKPRRASAARLSVGVAIGKSEPNMTRSVPRRRMVQARWGA